MGRRKAEVWFQASRGVPSSKFNRWRIHDSRQINRLPVLFFRGLCHQMDAGQVGRSRSCPAAKWSLAEVDFMGRTADDGSPIGALNKSIISITV